MWCTQSAVEYIPSPLILLYEVSGCIKHVMCVVSSQTISIGREKLRKERKLDAKGEKWTSGTGSRPRQVKGSKSGSNRGPCACEAHVITATLRKHIAPPKRAARRRRRPNRPVLDKNNQRYHATVRPVASRATKSAAGRCGIPRPVVDIVGVQLS
ncbi:hypothetical protein EVAR_13939_1 [Eumeta japonica]|uniref:Uncharacterized protein n=1 Tax=Eumeta variegata TaxID=151549 RepID=A0A4C1U8L8_EUMVA|nr:hypothetical protein EVAR_13939_1 [Eumeta japonica]